ncbi:MULTISPECIES: hypothetical protein [unclassified Azospirillum]|uniref:hypothetical protein n=1 Tax=unclassified Azospirillum TaxID=2630922 RepID=UPI000B792F14|nr:MULTISPECIES: hypothetical protein [unclassified Azospirillum]
MPPPKPGGMDRNGFSIRADWLTACMVRATLSAMVGSLHSAAHCSCHRSRYRRARSSSDGGSASRIDASSPYPQHGRETYNNALRRLI